MISSPDGLFTHRPLAALFFSLPVVEIEDHCDIPHAVRGFSYLQHLRLSRQSIALDCRKDTPRSMHYSHGCPVTLCSEADAVIKLYTAATYPGPRTRRGLQEVHSCQRCGTITCVFPLRISAPTAWHRWCKHCRYEVQSRKRTHTSRISWCHDEQDSRAYTCIHMYGNLTTSIEWLSKEGFH